MNGTKLRSLTVYLWQDSPINFELEDGTILEYVGYKNGQPTEEKDGILVPTGAPALTFVLRPVTEDTELIPTKEKKAGSKIKGSGV